MKNTQRQMVVADFDGTLIDDEEAIAMTTMLAVDEYRRNGNLFVVATGRIPVSVLEYSKDFNFIDYLIACNGAYVYDIKNKEEIFAKPLNKQIIRTIKQTYETICPIYFCTKENWNLYISTIFKTTKNNKLTSKIKDFNLFLAKKQKEIYKIELHFTNKKEATKALYDLLKEKLLIEVSMISYGKNIYIIEITDYKINKYKGISELAKKLNIRIKDITAIGDADNDIQMIKKVGHGIAVKNATSAVKKVATKTVASNNDKGVEQVILNINKKNKK